MWFIHDHPARSPRAGQLCAGPPWVGKWTARRMASGGARAAPHAAPSCTGFVPSAARLALPCSSGGTPSTTVDHPIPPPKICAIILFCFIFCSGACMDVQCGNMCGEKKDIIVFLK
uniref:Uncharacterized protein n=1 Tax=Triticum urartu TaxID=4572 RepID=A0A8R7JYS1_TRIUA